MAGYTVVASEAGSRADIFLASKFPRFSRSVIHQLFNKDMVRLGPKAIKASYKVQIGDKLNVDETYLSTKAPAINLPILYEDDSVIVIDKPSGLLTHAKGALNAESSVASFIADKIVDKQLDSNRAGIVHRLDRGTSGVIITAKTKAASDWLQKQFSKRSAKKVYWAIVHGAPNPSQAIIDAPIDRNPAKPQSFKVGPSGKNAITEYKVLKTSVKNSQRYSLVEIKPMTGRTHQIRVHLAYIKHPIVGDSLYGKDRGPIMLHASSLELTLPNGSRRKFISQTPSRLRDFFK